MVAHHGVDLDAFLDRDRRPADVPAGAAFDPWCLRVLSSEGFSSLGDGTARLSEEQLAYLAWLVVLAPTTHNTMPIRLRVDREERSLVVSLDREFVLPASDAVGRQAMVSLGCGITNAVIGAQRYGFVADLRQSPIPAEGVWPRRLDQPRYTPIARLHFTRSERVLAEPWIQAIRTRKVVRAEFDGRVRLDAGTARELSALVGAYPGLQLHLLEDAPTLLCLGKFQELADAAVMNRDQFSLELGRWLLDGDAPDAVGMRGREFGLTEEVTRRMQQGLLRKVPLLPDEVAAFARTGNVGMRSSSAVAVITVDRDVPEQWLAAGRAYEEMALLLEQRRFCTAMHAGITEVEGPNLMLRGRLRTKSRPTVVFRIGRPLHHEDGSRAHSARPHLRDILLPATID